MQAFRIGKVHLKNTLCQQVPGSGAFVLAVMRGIGFSGSFCCEVLSMAIRADDGGLTLPTMSSSKTVSTKTKSRRRGRYRSHRRVVMPLLRDDPFLDLAHLPLIQETKSRLQEE